MLANHAYLAEIYIKGRFKEKSLRQHLLIFPFDGIFPPVRGFLLNCERYELADDLPDLIKLIGVGGGFIGTLLKIRKMYTNYDTTFQWTKTS